jgi:hypothetical protein
MGQLNNIGPIDIRSTAAGITPSAYFNNLSLPPGYVTQDIDDAVQSFFEGITGSRDTAQVLASAVIYTSAAQGINPMVTLREFQNVSPGQINQYMTVFLNLNRYGTSLLGTINQPFVNQFIQRAILV